MFYQHYILKKFKATSIRLDFDWRIEFLSNNRNPIFFNKFFPECQFLHLSLQRVVYFTNIVANIPRRVPMSEITITTNLLIVIRGHLFPQMCGKQKLKVFGIFLTVQLEQYGSVGGTNGSFYRRKMFRKKRHHL